MQRAPREQEKDFLLIAVLGSIIIQYQQSETVLLRRGPYINFSWLVTVVYRNSDHELTGDLTRLHLGPVGYKEGILNTTSSVGERDLSPRQ